MLEHGTVLGQQLGPVPSRIEFAEVQSAGCEGPIEELAVTGEVGWVESKPVAEVPLGAFEALLGALRKENTFQGVEAFVFEWFEVLAKL